MIAKPLKTVRSSIHAVTSPKLLLTAAKILAACIVAVAIMLLLVRGTTPTTPTLPDGKVSSGNRAPSAPVMAAGGSAWTGTHGSFAHSDKRDGVLTSSFSSQSKERATWLQIISAK